MGAMLAKQKFADSFHPGDHASTFGGNPLAAAAANCVIDRLTSEGFLESVRQNGKYLKEKLTKLAEKKPSITGVRGVGLMLGAVMNVPTGPVIAKCLEDGLLLLGAGENVIRFVPPLIVGKKDIDKAVGIFGEAV